MTKLRKNDVVEFDGIKMLVLYQGKYEMKNWFYAISCNNGKHSKEWHPIFDEYLTFIKRNGEISDIY